MTRKVSVLVLVQLFVLSCVVAAQTAPATSIGKQSNRLSGGRANCKAMEPTNSDFHAATSRLLSMACR